MLAAILSIVLEMLMLGFGFGQIVYARGSLLRIALYAVGVAFMILAFTSVFVLRERGSSRVAKLRETVTAAYLNALERSSIKPSGSGDL